MSQRFVSPCLLGLVSALGLLGSGAAHAAGPTIVIAGEVVADCSDGVASYSDTLPFSVQFFQLSGNSSYRTDSFLQVSGSAFYHLQVGESSDLSGYYGAEVARTDYFDARQDVIVATAGTNFGSVGAVFVREDGPLLSPASEWSATPLGGDAIVSSFRTELANVENAAGDLCTVSVDASAPVSDLSVTIFDETMDSDGDGVPEATDRCVTVSALGYDAVDGDGCVDDSDYDGVTDLLDACPGRSDRVDFDGNGIPDGCDTGPFNEEAVTVTVTGSVPATCTDPAGSTYAASLPLALDVNYDDTAAYTYYDYAQEYGGVLYSGQSTYWSIDAWVNVGADAYSLSTGANSSWYHSAPTPRTAEGYVYQELGDGTYAYVYIQLPETFGDVRDFPEAGSRSLSYIQVQGVFANAAGDLCAVDLYEEGTPAGFTAIVSSAASDADGDGVADELDRCVGYDDGITGDTDHDGLCDPLDNCPAVANASQSDVDRDSLGDACERDTDGDGTIDDYDNCPDQFNTDQADSDADADGDVCDADDDNDGVSDTRDNCALLANAGQADHDRDGAGDACDGDDDADGVSDGADLCPGTPMDVRYDNAGCSGTQRVDLTCGEPCDYSNSGHYVSCVTQAANGARSSGLITNTEKASLVREAARNRCE